MISPRLTMREVLLNDDTEVKKPRMSARNSLDKEKEGEQAAQKEVIDHHLKNNGAMPSPVTKGSTDTTEVAHVPDSPVNGKAVQAHHRKPIRARLKLQAYLGLPTTTAMRA